MLQSAIEQCATYGRRNYHRRYTLRIARLANKARLGKLSARMGCCSETLGYGDKGQVVARIACRCRECSTCQGARSARWAHRVHDAMAVIAAEHADWRFLFLTVTMPSVPLAELRAGVSKLHAHLDKMTRRAAFAPVGWIRNTEQTIANGWAHPHAHILGAVPASYFAAPLHKERGPNGRPRIVPGYMTQRQWQLLYAECAGIERPIDDAGRPMSYLDVPEDMTTDAWRALWPNHDAPVIDIRAIKGDLSSKSVRKELYEITKYGTKPGDLVRLAPDDFRTLHEQVQGTRTISICGELAPYLKEIPDEEDTPLVSPSVVIAARWNEEHKRYLTNFGYFLELDGKAQWCGPLVNEQEKRIELNRSREPDRRLLMVRALQKNHIAQTDLDAAERIRTGASTRDDERAWRVKQAHAAAATRTTSEERKREWLIDELVTLANHRARGVVVQPDYDYHTCAFPPCVIETGQFTIVNGKLSRIVGTA